MLKVGDLVKTTGGYTTDNPNGTLYHALPSDYVLEGKVLSVTPSFYQLDNNVNVLVVERLSASPEGLKLRKQYLLWQRANGEIIV